MRRAAVLYWFLLTGAVLSGCGAASRTQSPSPASSLAAAPRGNGEAPAGRLDSAREEYYLGVKSYVREEFEEAESHFLSSIALLEAPLPEAFGFEGDLEESETLLTKSNYFLQKISEREVAQIEIPEAVEPASGEPPLDLSFDAVPDWEITAGGPIQQVRNAMVDKWVDYFLGDGRQVYQTWLNRRYRYQAIYDDAFRRYGLPREITFHSMIESGFSHRAYSWAHAVGLWQFIKSTGRNYGLRCDGYVDERRDPVKATDAAARYLRALYDEFGDWELALAAYNVGEGGVRRAISRQGTRNFWDLRLPRETRNHVPKFYAAMLLGMNPEQYGFTVTPELPYDTEEIAVDSYVDFETLGRCAGVSAEALAELNPALVRKCTPPNESGFRVQVPSGFGERTMLALASIPASERRPPAKIDVAYHRVRRGETLSKIARRYHTSVQAIAQANRLGSRNRVYAGQQLTIPGASDDGSVRVASKPRSSSSSRPSTARQAPSGTEQVVYVVKSGDTLSRIAERHGVSTTKLRSWNKVGRHIRPGDRLTIHVKEGAAPRVGQASSSKSEKSSRPTIVRVRRGDTLWDIARTNGVSLSELLTANGMKRTARIKPGDRIKIPTK